MSIDTHFKVLLFYIGNRDLLENPFNKEELFYLDNWFDTNIPTGDLCIYLVHDLEWVRMFAKRSMDRRK